jgi:hypothetical protein
MPTKKCPKVLVEWVKCVGSLIECYRTLLAERSVCVCICVCACACVCVCVCVLCVSLKCPALFQRRAVEGLISLVDLMCERSYLWMRAKRCTVLNML